MHFPDDVAPLLTRMPEALKHHLGQTLVGVYVYGSVLDSEFDPARSDVDCIAVTERALNELEFRQVDSWLKKAAAADPWVERLQMSFLIKASVFSESKVSMSAAALCGVLHPSHSFRESPQRSFGRH